MYKILHMKPIELTKYGETLREYPKQGKESSLEPKKPDEDKLSLCIGVHDICNGWMDIKVVSKTYQAISCRACGLRLVIPISITTFGQLRKYCQQN